MTRRPDFPRTVQGLVAPSGLSIPRREDSVEFGLGDHRLVKVARRALRESLERPPSAGAEIRHAPIEIRRELGGLIGSYRLAHAGSGSRRPSISPTAKPMPFAEQGRSCSGIRPAFRGWWRRQRATRLAPGCAREGRGGRPRGSEPQSRASRRPGNPVYLQGALLLEGPDRPVGRRAEHPVTLESEAGVEERLLEGLNILAAHPWG